MLSHYYDINLYHDVVTGWSATGILHFMNTMPIEWLVVQEARYSRNSNIWQQVHHHSHLYWSGDWPQINSSYISLVSLSTMSATSLVTKRLLSKLPLTPSHANLHKCHNALSFHQVWEAMASKYIIMTYMPSMDDPADILSKHWAYQVVYQILKPILFFSENMVDIIQEGWSNTMISSLDIHVG